MQRKYRKKRRRWPLYVLAVLCMALTVPSAYHVFQEQAQRGEAAKLAGLVSESIVQADPQQIPDYSGEDVIEIPPLLQRRTLPALPANTTAAWTFWAAAGQRRRCCTVP